MLGGVLAVLGRVPDARPEDVSFFSGAGCRDVG